MADGARVTSIAAVGTHDYRVEIERDGISRGFIFTVDDGPVPVVSSSREFNVAMRYNQSETLDLARAVAALHTARQTALAVDLDFLAPWRALLTQAVAAGGLDPASPCPICTAQRLRLEVTAHREGGWGSAALWCQSCLNGLSFENVEVPVGQAVSPEALPEFYDLGQARDRRERSRGTS